jgi:hypothetical protein
MYVCSCVSCVVIILPLMLFCLSLSSCGFRPFIFPFVTSRTIWRWIRGTEEILWQWKGKDKQIYVFNVSESNLRTAVVSGSLCCTARHMGSVAFRFICLISVSNELSVSQSLFVFFRLFLLLGRIFLKTSMLGAKPCQPYHTKPCQPCPICKNKRNVG